LPLLASTKSVRPAVDVGSALNRGALSSRTWKLIISRNIIAIQVRKGIVFGSVAMLFKFALALGVLFAFCDALSRQKRIVGGYPSLLPESDSFNVSQPSGNYGNSLSNQNIVVQVQDDYRSATVTGVEEPEGYQAYKGIRYAEPPVGRLRFQVRRRRVVCILNI